MRTVPVYGLALVALAACGEGDPDNVRSTALPLTVEEAIGASCSTTIVKGLSEQIVAQSNCLDPGAFVAIPPRPNLTLGAAVFPYLEESARDAFVAVLDENAGTDMTVNSMLRTVAQQYLLYEWYLGGDCGIGLAATPGGSNHETGLAVDISDYATWKAALEAHGFQWLGASDVVHFDYAGPGAVDHKGLDVLAFQMLWNLNHPDDPIAEDGDYGPQTGARLALSPAEGFPVPPTCASPSLPNVELSATLEGATDTFPDGASAGIADLLVGAEHTFVFGLYNAGSSDAGAVRVRVLAGDDELVASDWSIETDLGHPGTFEPDPSSSSLENPPHGPLGEGAVLTLSSLAPGETKTVRLAARAEAYSVLADPPPALRLFVAEVPGHYAQAEWGGAVTGDDSQTWGAGRLEIELQADVYAPDRFEWETDRLEGWGTNGPDAVVSVEGGALRVDGAASNQAVSFDAAAGVRLRARRTSGPSELRALFASGSEPTLSPARTIALELPADGAFHELALDPSSHPEWAGTITALALAGGTFEVDWIRAGATVPGGGGKASAGCACSAGADASGGILPMASLLLILLRRRKRA